MLIPLAQVANMTNQSERTRRRNRRAGTGRVRMFPPNTFTGRRLMNLPIEPPQFNETPMYPITIEIRKAFESGVAYNLTPKIIANQIRTQFGLTGGGSISMKLTSMHLYGIADATSVAPMLNCDVSCLSPQVDDNVSSTAPIGVYYGLVAKLKDVGTLNRPCKAGWEWSRTDQSRVINEASDFEVLNWAYTGTATGILRVKLQFSFSGAAAPQGP